MEYYDKALEIIESIEEIDYDLTKSQEISHMLAKACLLYTSRCV